jgi:hypothetical protein
MKEEKSAWNDISTVWKRIAAVVAAMGVITTFFVNVFGSPLDKTVTITSCLGVVILLISFYVDRQTKYIREEIKDNRKVSDDKLSEHISESNKMIQTFGDTLKEMKKTGEDTRKDTLRIQLLMILKDQPENTDTILKLAETYFVHLKGDWYMTNEFMKWAKAHDIMIPDNIFGSLNMKNN